MLCQDEYIFNMELVFCCERTMIWARFAPQESCMSRTRHLILSNLAVCLLFSTLAAAKQSADQVQIGRNIVVQSGENVGDLVCVGCSIFVRGQATGDAVAVGGSVVLEQGAQVAGSVTTVAGDIRLQDGAQIGGDVTAVAGIVRRGPQSSIGGDVTSMGGAGWALLVLVVPLVFLGGIVALIVWLTQRSRRVVAAPA